MWAPIIMMMMMAFLHTVSVTNEECNKPNCKNAANETCELKWSDFQHCQNVYLRNNSIVNIETSFNYAAIQKLDLSYNKLRKLPKDFLSNAKALIEINLAHNSLEELPITFLSNSSNLQVVHLEGNLLAEVPSTVFHSGLLNLSVDCRCDVVSIIVQNQNINSTKPLRLSAICSTTSSVLKVDDFFEHNCGTQMWLALYIVLPIAVLGLVIGGVVLYLWKTKHNSRNLENKPTSDKSPSHRQPRYMTRNMDVMASTSNQGQRQDYENVFVGNPNTNMKPYEYVREHSISGAHSKRTIEEDFYLESDVNEGSQPIYTNTQGVYYNYQKPSNNIIKEEDDVYILPDQ